MSWMGVPVGDWSYEKHSRRDETSNAITTKNGIDDLDEDQQAVDLFPPSQRHFYETTHQAEKTTYQKPWNDEYEDVFVPGGAKDTVSRKRRALWHIPDGHSDVSDSTAVRVPRRWERKREHIDTEGLPAQRREGRAEVADHHHALPPPPRTQQEEKRRRLLEMDDWTGAKARQPLTMHFERFSQDAPAWGWKEDKQPAENSAAENTPRRSDHVRMSDKMDSLPRPVNHATRRSGDGRLPATIGRQQQRTGALLPHKPLGSRGAGMGRMLPSPIHRPGMVVPHAGFAQFEQWPTASSPLSPLVHQRKAPGPSSSVRSSTTATSTTLPPQMYATKTSSPRTESSQTYERTRGPQNMMTDQWHDPVSRQRQHETPLQKAWIGPSRQPQPDMTTPPPAMPQSLASNKTKPYHSVSTIPERLLPQEAERDLETIDSAILTPPPRAAWPNAGTVVGGTQPPDDDDPVTYPSSAHHRGTNPARSRSRSWTSDALRDKNRCGDKNGGRYRATGEQEQRDGASSKIRTRSTAVTMESNAERDTEINKEEDTDNYEESTGLFAVQRVDIRSLPSLNIDEDPIEDDEADDIPVAKPVRRAKYR